MSSDTDRITFKEQYNNEVNWQKKATLISLYHSIMCYKYSDWHIKDTATHFEISIGLVSENIRLSMELDNGNTRISESRTREEALKLIDRRSYIRD